MLSLADLSSSIKAVPVQRISIAENSGKFSACMQGLPVEAINKGAVKNIQIQMEDRMGGRKHATKLSHVESFALDPNDLAGELQRKFQVQA